jgi:uncharacterized protein YciI
MYIILLTYLVDLTEVDKHLNGHREHLKKYYDNGTFICSGPRNPRNGGVILCRALDEDVVTKIANEDPFITNGVASFELINFQTNNYLEEFKPFLD